MFYFLQKLIHTTTEFLFPSSCVGCKQVGTLLCDSCTDQLELNNKDTDFVVTALSYQDPKVKKLIWQMKYRGSPEATKILAHYLIKEILRIKINLNLDQIILIPIPMTKSHQRRRGWNQTESLAREMIKQRPTDFCIDTKSLVKTKTTPTQVSLAKRSSRLKNLTGAFTLTSNQKLTGQTICILDDVTTTGSTLTEVAITVAQAKPKYVLLAAVANG